MPLYCLIKFFFEGWDLAALSDPWHAGGRPSTTAGAAAAAAAVLSPTLTHMDWTNLTVATAQIFFGNLYT